MHFKYRSRTHDRIEKKLNIFFGKIKNNTTFIAFLCTILGAWFLQAFSIEHIVKFMDVLNPAILITGGAIFLIILIFLFIPLILVIILSSKLTKLIVSKIPLPDVNKINFLFMTHAFLSGFLYYFTIYTGIIIVILYLLTIGCMIKKTNLSKASGIVKNTMIITGLLMMVTLSTYAGLWASMYILDYKIHSDSINDMFTTILTVSLITWIITTVSYTSPDKSIEKRMSFYACVAISFSFVVSIILGTQCSEKIVKFIGIGLQEKCYYTSDLKKYHIPSELITRIDDQRTKLFVVFDTGEKMYIAENSRYRSSFIFKSDELSQTPCDGSINAKPNYFPYNTI